MIKRTLYVNGVRKTLIAAPDASLADVLREQLHLTGTKIGCGQGQCGCCSVILDGKLVRSCVTSMKRVADEACVTTVEGIGDPDNLHPMQLALVAYGAPQCGFCMPGLRRLGQGAAEREPEPQPGGRARLVPDEPQRLPLHRLQADRRRGHGRGQGAARRDAARGPGVHDAGRRPHLGHLVSAPVGGGQGHRHDRLRRRPGPQDARRHAAAGPGAGRGLARQHPRHRHLRGREDARRRTRSSPTRTSRARTASPA